MLLLPKSASSLSSGMLWATVQSYAFLLDGKRDKGALIEFLVSTSLGTSDFSASGNELPNVHVKDERRKQIRGVVAALVKMDILVVNGPFVLLPTISNPAYYEMKYFKDIRGKHGFADGESCCRDSDGIPMKGGQWNRFKIFWDAYNHKFDRGRAQSAWRIMEDRIIRGRHVDAFPDDLFHWIVACAKEEAKIRKGSDIENPKRGARWINDLAWENDVYKTRIARLNRMEENRAGYHIESGTDLSRGESEANNVGWRGQQ